MAFNQALTNPKQFLKRGSKVMTTMVSRSPLPPFIHLFMCIAVVTTMVMTIVVNQARRASSEGFPVVRCPSYGGSIKNIPQVRWDIFVRTIVFAIKLRISHTFDVTMMMVLVKKFLT